MRGLVAACVAAAACGGGGKDAAVCRHEAAELGALLSSIDHEMPPVYVRDGTLVMRRELPAVDLGHAPDVTITSAGLSHQGQPVDGATLAERLAAAHERDPDLAFLVATEDARWEDVARALRALHEAGYQRPAVWFARAPAPVAKPPRSKIDDELDRILRDEEPSNKATELARLVEKVVKGCPAIQEVFGAVASVEGESKAETIIRAIEPALIACNCNLDLPSFRSAMFRLLYVDTPLTAFRITLDPAAAAITLPPSTPWRTAHDRFAPEARVWVNAP